MLDFLGIGAQKAGTTWLYEQLSRHPDILFPAGKEVHFWDSEKRDLRAYTETFPDVEGKVSGEITPAYAILPKERIREIYKHFPNLKLIYLTRNPIERAWSSALMALKRSEMELHEASDTWFIDHFHSAGSRLRGDYAKCLDTWQEVYDPRALLVQRYEMITTQPRLLLKACARHIGVNADFFDTLKEASLKEKVFAGPGYDIRPSLLPVLQDIYKDKMQ